jgi:excisionase family DNA binding protein
VSIKRKAEISFSAEHRQFDIGDCVFTIPEAAAHLKISRAFIYRLIGDGKLKPSKIGSRTIVPGAEIRRFMKSLAA